MSHRSAGVRGTLGLRRAAFRGDHLGRAFVTTLVTVCLVVGTGSPQAAVASSADVHQPVLVASGTQSFISSAASPTVPDRGTFGVVVPVERRPVVRPVDGSTPASGGFGGRNVAGCRACSTNHRGVDFAAPAGTTIRVVLDGVVEAAGTNGGYGQTVIVRHTSGLATRYAHMSSIDVRVGETVTTGTRLGAVGSTGVSTGPHLHFEVLVGGEQVDPGPWLRSYGVD